jgi:hypothetical protein
MKLDQLKSHTRGHMAIPRKPIKSGIVKVQQAILVWSFFLVLRTTTPQRSCLQYNLIFFLR